MFVMSESDPHIRSGDECNQYMAYLFTVENIGRSTATAATRHRAADTKKA